MLFEAPGFPGGDREILCGRLDMFLEKRRS